MPPGEMCAKRSSGDLVSLCLEPLEKLLESIQTGLTHPVQGVGPFHLAEVRRPVATRGV